MLFILIHWTIIFCLCLILGHGKAWTFSKQRNTALDPESQAIPFSIKLLLGLGLMAGIGQWMSILAPTDLQGYPFLFIPVVSMLFNKDLRLSISKSIRESLSPKSALWYIGALVFIIIALGLALRNTTNIDEAGYYLPLVKWIEQYKVTAGTALLHHRLGFNSSLHLLSALFSGTYFQEGGIYEINALLFIGFNLYFLSALIRLLKSIFQTKSNYASSINPSDLLLTSALIFPFSFLCDSMDSDYLGVMGGIVVLAWIWENLNKEKTSIPTMATMFVICTFLITVKPFAVFLMAGPLYLFVKNKLNRIDFLRFIIIAGIIILPWLIRNYYISGYLIFPVYYLDLFNPDWKVPLSVTKPTYDIIGEFAKLQIIRPDYLYDGVTHPALSEWFPIWLSFTWKTAIGKIVILTTPLSILALLLKAALDKRQTRKLQPIHYGLLYVSIICMLWFFAFPSIRFAWAWLLTLMVGSVWIWIKDESHRLKKLFVIALCILVISSWTRLLINTDFNNLTEHLITPPKTTTSLKHSTKQLNNDVIINYANDPHCHGMNPPCAPHNNKLNIEARGKKVEDGFKMSTSK